ncbi:unnamed protein product [Psylliodes chrysocephalus]|uniref:Uncharacterized protein n=1 Tax=Psylliodes chrysocephalus TaxID=3402493 RepID=A0A9P0GFB6_9CUCU|nr:unnamed protein product [Psylliodes chrysocephala]CAH1107287.1 unnamed protein product [Psylliodes chrysocephala]
MFFVNFLTLITCDRDTSLYCQNNIYCQVKSNNSKILFKMRIPSDIIVIIFVITIPLLATMITMHTKYMPLRKMQDMMALGWNSLSRATYQPSTDLPFDGQCVINFTGLIFQTSSYVALFQPVNCEFWDIGSRNISFFRLAETHIQIEGHCQCRGKKYPANKTDTEIQKTSRRMKKTNPSYTATTRTALEEPGTKNLRTTDGIQKMKSTQNPRGTNTLKDTGTEVLQTTEGENNMNISEKPIATQLTQGLGTERVRTTEATERTKSSQARDLEEIATEVTQTIRSMDNTNSSEKPILTQVTQELGTKRLLTTEEATAKTKSSLTPDSEDLGVEELQTNEAIEKTKSPQNPVITETIEDLSVQGLQSSESVEKTKLTQNPIATKTFGDFSETINEAQSSKKEDSKIQSKSDIYFDTKETTKEGSEIQSKSDMYFDTKETTKEGSEIQSKNDDMYFDTKEPTKEGSEIQSKNDMYFDTKETTKEGSEIQSKSDTYFDTKGTSDFRKHKVKSNSSLTETPSTISSFYNKQESNSNNTEIEISDAEFEGSSSSGISLDSVQVQDESKSSFSASNEGTSEYIKHEITPPMPLNVPNIPPIFITRESKKVSTRAGVMNTQSKGDMMILTKKLYNNYKKEGNLSVGFDYSHENTANIYAEIEKSNSEYKRFIALLFNKNQNNSGSALSIDSSEVDLVSIPEETSMYDSIITKETPSSSSASFENIHIPTQIEKPISTGGSVLSRGETSKNSEFMSLFSRYLKENINIFTTEMSENLLTKGYLNNRGKESEIISNKVKIPSYLTSDCSSSILEGIASDINQEYKSDSQYINSLSTGYSYHKKETETEQVSLEHETIKSSAVTLFNQDISESESQKQYSVLGKTYSSLQNFGSSSTEQPSYSSDTSENVSTDIEKFGSISSKTSLLFSSTDQTQNVSQLTELYSKEESSNLSREIERYSPEYGVEEVASGSSEYLIKRNIYSKDSSSNIPIETSESDLPKSSEFSSSSYPKNQTKIFTVEATLDRSDYARSTLTDTSITNKETDSSFSSTGYSSYYKNKLASDSTEVTISSLLFSTVGRSESEKSQSIGFFPIGEQEFGSISTAYSSYSRENFITVTNNSKEISRTSASGTASGISEFEIFLSTDSSNLYQSNTDIISQSLGFSSTGYSGYPMKESQSISADPPLSDVLYFTESSELPLSEDISNRALENVITTADTSSISKHETLSSTTSSLYSKQDSNSNPPFSVILYSEYSYSTETSEQLLSEDLSNQAMGNVITTADTSTISEHETLSSTSFLYRKQDSNSNPPSSVVMYTGYSYFTESSELLLSEDISNRALGNVITKADTSTISKYETPSSTTSSLYSNEESNSNLQSSVVMYSGYSYSTESSELLISEDISNRALRNAITIADTSTISKHESLSSTTSSLYSKQDSNSNPPSSVVFYSGYSTYSTESSELLPSEDISNRALGNVITTADASTISKHESISSTISSLYSKQESNSNRAELESSLSFGMSLDSVQVQDISESSFSIPSDGSSGISEYMNSISSSSE